MTRPCFHTWIVRGGAVARRSFAATLIALTVGMVAPLAAQPAPFPRLVATTAGAQALCATVEPLVASDGSGATASAAARDSAARLAESAALATLAGELDRARTQLREATTLDPTSPELSYRLARAADDLGDTETAAAAYCHLQSISTDSAQRDDATTRVRELSVDRGILPPDQALVRFQRGISDAAAGDYAMAERAFDDAITRAPSFAAAYYDRALIRLARGDAPGAESDLARLAALSPSAIGPELHDVRRSLQRASRSPATAFGAGLIPGGAQVYTGRPWLGAVVAAATAAGVFIALQEKTTAEERSFVDPFGNSYTDMVPVTGHPRRTLGFAIAGGAMAAGMLEGVLHVTTGRASVGRIARRVMASFGAPAVEATTDGEPR